MVEIRLLALEDEPLVPLRVAVPRELAVLRDVSERRNRVRAPVDEYAELGLRPPGRYGAAVYRLPCRLVLLGKAGRRRRKADCEQHPLHKNFLHVSFLLLSPCFPILPRQTLVSILSAKPASPADAAATRHAAAARAIVLTFILRICTTHGFSVLVSSAWSWHYFTIPAEKRQPLLR